MKKPKKSWTQAQIRQFEHVGRMCRIVMKMPLKGEDFSKPPKTK